MTFDQEVRKFKDRMWVEQNVSHNLEEKTNKTGVACLTKRIKRKVYLVAADLLNYRMCHSSGRLLGTETV